MEEEEDMEMTQRQLFERASPAPGRPKAGEIPSGDRLRYSAGEGSS
jgi:hypothetical protein